MELKLILKDGTEVELIDATYTHDFVVQCANREAFRDVWDKLTPDNLSEISITDAGVTVQTMTGLVLDGVQAVINPDGTITGHFYFHGTYTENDPYAEAGKILLGEE